MNHVVIFKGQRAVITFDPEINSFLARLPN